MTDEAKTEEVAIEDAQSDKAGIDEFVDHDDLGNDALSEIERDYQAGEDQLKVDLEKAMGGFDPDAKEKVETAAADKPDESDPGEPEPDADPVADSEATAAPVDDPAVEPEKAEDTLDKFNAELFGEHGSVPGGIQQAAQQAAQAPLQTQQGQPAPQPQAPPPMALTVDPNAPAPSFVTQEEYTAMMESPEAMNKVLGQVAARAQNATVEALHSYLPGMIDRGVAQGVTTQMVESEFFRENQDLRDDAARAVINDYGAKIRSAHPEWTLQQLFKAAERGTRLAMKRPKKGLPQQTKVQGKRVVERTQVRRPVKTGPAARPPQKTKEPEPSELDDLDIGGTRIPFDSWSVDETKAKN